MSVANCWTAPQSGYCLQAVRPSFVSHSRHSLYGAIAIDVFGVPSDSEGAVLIATLPLYSPLNSHSFCGGIVNLAAPFIHSLPAFPSLFASDPWWHCHKVRLYKEGWRIALRIALL